MMLVCKSQRDINVQEAVGMYEFSVVPRSLFAPDGTMLYCNAKSDLMSILEKLPEEAMDDQDETDDQRTTNNYKVAIVDGMAELQSLKKPDSIKDCLQLAEHFCDRIFTKYADYSEIRLIFDRYDVPVSLKEATRRRRQGNTDAVHYKVTESTQISKVPMKRLLSHNLTKMELTALISKTALQLGNGKRLLVSWGSFCQANFKETNNIQSNQEEADTKLILHAVDATKDGATEIEIHSPDTDVFILSLRRYPDLCEQTSFVTGTGQRRRTISLKPIVQVLGQDKTLALPGLHALSGADNTGSFSGKGKVACFKVMQENDEEIINALKDLGTTQYPSDETMTGIEKFVCKLFCSKTSITKVHELRWYLFKKKQAQSERLPPTKSALKEAILRAHYQAMIWNSATTCNPEIPSPEGYGWRLVDNKWTPVMTSLPPAPEAILQLVKCGCAKDKCQTKRCQCVKAGLKCTDLCKCSDDDEMCENTLPDVFDEEEDSDDEDYNSDIDDF